MTLLQALLIALFGYLSSNYSPWCFGQLGGWYTMGRPLVSGLIIGSYSRGRADWNPDGRCRPDFVYRPGYTGTVDAGGSEFRGLYGYSISHGGRRIDGICVEPVGSAKLSGQFR